MYYRTVSREQVHLVTMLYAEFPVFKRCIDHLVAETMERVNAQNAAAQRIAGELIFNLVMYGFVYVHLEKSKRGEDGAPEGHVVSPTRVYTRVAQWHGSPKTFYAYAYTDDDNGVSRVSTEAYMDPRLVILTLRDPILLHGATDANLDAPGVHCAPIFFRLKRMQYNVGRMISQNAHPTLVRQIRDIDLSDEKLQESLLEYGAAKSTYYRGMDNPPETTRGLAPTDEYLRRYVKTYEEMTGSYARTRPRAYAAASSVMENATNTSYTLAVEDRVMEVPGMASVAQKEEATRARETPVQTVAAERVMPSQAIPYYNHMHQESEVASIEVCLACGVPVQEVLPHLRGATSNHTKAASISGTKGMDYKIDQLLDRVRHVSEMLDLDIVVSARSVARAHITADDLAKMVDKGIVTPQIAARLARIPQMLEQVESESTLYRDDAPPPKREKSMNRGPRS